MIGRLLFLSCFVILAGRAEVITLPEFQSTGGMRCATVALEGDSFYLLTAVRAGDAEMSAVLRTEEGRWMFEYYGISGKDGRLTARICTPENGRKLEIRLTGNSEFRDIKLEKINRNAISGGASMKFYVNMDYFDDVYYSEKLGTEEYGEKEIAEFFRQCREKNVSGVFWRVSAHGQMVYHSKGAATVFPGLVSDERLDPGRRKVAQILRKIDPLEIAVREARRNGIAIYIWMTLSDEAIPHETIPDFCMSEFQIRNRHTMLMDRTGKVLPGTMCYNEPEALAYRLAIVRELLDYKADGLYFCTRSHSHQFGRDRGDDYGFNPSIVTEYRRLYGKNILTEDFDVEKWRNIKRDGYDRLLREASALIHASGQKLLLGTAAATLSNGTILSNYGKTPFPWESNLRAGRIDGIVSGQYLVSDYFASREFNRFCRAAGSNQEFFFWSQLYHYGMRRTFHVDEVLKQTKTFAFLQPTGVLYHEAMNLEQDPAGLYTSLSVFFSTEK